MDISEVISIALPIVYVLVGAALSIGIGIL